MAMVKGIRQDSSDSEQETKKQKYEESSEDEEKEDEDEKPEEEEVEMNEVKKGKHSTLHAEKWSAEDSQKLIGAITMLLPPSDLIPYKEREAQLDWEKVAFGTFSADDCRKQWCVLTRKIRLYRTMSDLASELMTLLPRPPSSFQIIQKYNQGMQFTIVSGKRKSSLPKFSMNVYSLFTKENLQAYKHIPAVERMKHVSQLYKHQSEAEKKELVERYNRMKANHIKMLQKLKDDNPALAVEVDTEITKLQKTPAKYKLPKISVQNQNNSILKYLNKKTAPVETDEERKHNNHSADFTKKSESDPLSSMTDEEEDPSDSSEEERNLSVARSPKNSPSVKSPTRPKKPKAMVEKSSLPHYNGHEDEGNLPPKTSATAKSTSSPEKLKATVKRPVSEQTESVDTEHIKRPKKSHTELKAPTSKQEKSLQLTSFEPESKPNKKSKKKKIKEILETGLNQFVQGKMAAYQQKYPELNSREIVMKLAGKWEKLSDAKKNKYEKLALKNMSYEGDN